MADIADDLRAIEDHVAGRAVLHALAAHLADHVERLRVGHLVGGDEPGPDRAEGVGALALGPLPAALDLEFALGNVVDDAIAGDVFERVVLGDILRRGADDDAEFDLPIAFLRALRQDDVVIGAADASWSPS